MTRCAAGATARPSTNWCPRATPPAVLTMTASSAGDGGPGQRMRSGPSSRRRERRVMPALAFTANSIRPTARFDAKMSFDSAYGALISNRHRSNRHRSNRHGALERCLVHGIAAAGIDDRTAVHDREKVAELACKIEILLDQHDRDLPEIAQIGDRAADILDDRRLDAF